MKFLVHLATLIAEIKHTDMANDSSTSDLTQVSAKPSPHTMEHGKNQLNQIFPIILEDLEFNGMCFSL